MRILHLTSFVQGGAGQALTELALGQRRTGHTVAVVTSNTPAATGANIPELLARLALGGVDVHLVDSLAARQTGPNADVVQFVHDQLGTAAAFDVLHTHGTVPSVIAIAASRKVTTRVPILQTTHEWRVGRGHGAPRSYDLEVMNLVDRAVVPTWSVADHFASHGVVRRQLAVVPYGVRTEPPSGPGDGLASDMRDWRTAGGAVLCYVGAPGSTHDERLLQHALPHIDPQLKLLCVLFGVAPAGWASEPTAGVRVVGPAVPIRSARTSTTPTSSCLPSATGRATGRIDLSPEGQDEEVGVVEVLADRMGATGHHDADTSGRLAGPTGGRRRRRARTAASTADRCAAARAGAAARRASSQEHRRSTAPRRRRSRQSRMSEANPSPGPDGGSVRTP